MVESADGQEFIHFRFIDLHMFTSPSALGLGLRRQSLSTASYLKEGPCLVLKAAEGDKKIGKKSS